jgi:heterodisulfide reductase subunit A
MADGLATEKDPCIAPVESSVKGVFLVGTVNAPMDIRDSIVQGNAAAAKMMAFIRNRGET